MMKRENEMKGLALVIIAVALVFSSAYLFSAASYSRTNPSYTQTTFPTQVGSVDFPFMFNREMCGAGQDFLLQVSPFGCTPSVVRSDLLEEQNVPVFCPIVGTKLNPLIDVEAINNIHFSYNGRAPPEVQGLSYMPSRAALGSQMGLFGNSQIQINQPALNSMGYAVIVLRQQRNESAMPDFVQGNLTATLRYDIKNAFGVGKQVYYLPEISDEEQWDNNYLRYSFWRGKGYLRAESIGEDSAFISVYSDREAYSTAKTGDKRKISSNNIRVGNFTRAPMPGFNYCLGEMEIKVEGLVNPDTRARLRVNEDFNEFAKGEKFLENKCEIKSIEKYGALQKIKISCSQDEKSSPGELIISPKASLEFEGSNTEGYSVGDFLYSYKTTKDGKEEIKNVYLGFIGLEKKSNVKESLYVTLVAIPTKGRSEAQLSKMTNSEILDMTNYDKGWFAKTVVLVKKEPQGWDFSDKMLTNGVTMDFSGKKVVLKGFANAVDEVLPYVTAEQKNLKDSYTKAMNDYEKVRQDFSIETYSGSDKMLGERALLNEIDLAWKTNQKKTSQNLCKEFVDSYPNSEYPSDCDNALKLSSEESDTMNVLINGRIYLIAFDGIEEPSSEEYGVEISVGGATDGAGALGPYKVSNILVGKHEAVPVSAKESFELIGLDSDYATFDVRGIERSRADNLKTTIKVNLNSEGFVGEKNYKISVHKINLKKMAKVSVNPRIDLTESKANVSFKIGIEKRGIQLSPEKTRDKIESLNATLEKWHGINDRLGSIVQTGKTACIGVGAALTFKNFLANMDGAGIARQKVMRGDNGWFERCQKEVNNQRYSDVDKCLLNNSDNIEASINVVAEGMQRQDVDISLLQKSIPSTSFLGEDIPNTEKLMQGYIAEKYTDELSSNLENAEISTTIVGGENVPVSEIIKLITPTSVFLSQAKNLQLNSRLLNEEGVVGEIARAEVKKELADIWVNNKKISEQRSLVEEVGSEAATLFSSKKLGEIKITEVETWGKVKGGYSGALIDDTSFVYFLKDQFDGQRYLLVLDKDYVVRQTFKISGTALSIADDKSINPLKLAFKKYEASTYENPYTPLSSAEIKYFETEPYKGLPAIVPFDLKNGWYAAVKSVLPIGGAIKPYDDSGRVSSFWICNIGANKKEDGIGTDECQQFVPRASQPPVFSGLDPTKAESLAKRAEEAIITASQARARNPAVSSVNINGQVIKVGEPAADIPDIQCQDFMSPADCNLLFNVCDPVVCPSSRCDLGGTYPVRDVVQSGVAGSLLLCLPNFPDVKIPICLSGVHAGLEGYLSVVDAYQQCLQTSLETGQQVGVCDEIHSVYMCDFFWRQGLPLAKIVAPKVISSALGQGTRGGGEYLGVQDAWNKAGDSVDFFTQYYAENSYKAFKARSLEGVGTEVCKNWMSFSAPNGGDLLDAITTPDVPTQFYGRFDEIPYTTATNPPISQYKVFYHIFAGKDFPAYYQVYLKGETGTFFQDTNIRRVVANGFIKQGESETQTEDFTAPAGYKQLCIVVNGQEECGFKQVTTDFGVNYMTEAFVASQANQTGITSESACISGTASALSLLTPNVQSAAEGLANPAIYDRGITRICATNNPGEATDSSKGTSDPRWRQVGICGDTNIKCWLDTQSVTNTIKSTTLEGEALGEVTSGVVSTLGSAELSEKEFSDVVKEVSDASTPLKKLEIIVSNYNKVSVSNRKGYLTLLRADAYSGIIAEILAKWKKEKAAADAKKAEADAAAAAKQATEKAQTSVRKCEECSGVGFTGLFNPCSKEECSEIEATGASCIFEDKGENTCVDASLTVFPNSKPLLAYFPTFSDTIFNFEERNDGATVKYVVLHHTAGDSAVDAIGAFVRDRNSIHYIVDKEGNVMRIVSEEKSAQHANCVNSLSVGIEIVNEGDGKDPYPKAQRDSVTNLLSYLVDKYEIQPGNIIGHGCTNPDREANEPTGLEPNFMYASDKTFPAGYEISERANNKCPVRCEDGKPVETATGDAITGAAVSTCTTKEECQKILGNKIMELAKAKKAEKGNPEFMSDAVVQEVGIKNFECLALMVAYRESSIQHCETPQKNKNPLYCDGVQGSVLGGDSAQGGSLGVMQINAIHASKLDRNDFIENVEYGIDLLAYNYGAIPAGSGCSANPSDCAYRCYRPKELLSSPIRDSDFQTKLYTGWERAIRNYNGWNTKCWCYADSEGKCTTAITEMKIEVGNNRYVDDVLYNSVPDKIKDEVIELFPECGDSFVSTDSTISSFVPGTQVLTPEGQVAIEKLKVGDEVLSVDTSSNFFFEKSILNVYEHSAKNTRRITLNDGTILEVTFEHPFYDPVSFTYKPIKEFQEGDKVLTLDGSGSRKELNITSIETIPSYEGLPVYNLNVEGPFNNYLANGVLVHNKPMASSDEGTIDASSYSIFLTDVNARELLDGSGITVNHPKPTTSLSGLRQSTLEEVLNLKNSCSICSIQVTGGTESVHASITQFNHANGYKVDLALNSALNSYIKSNFKYSGKRSDGALLYKNLQSGAVYALEGDHWDILVTPLAE